MWQHLTDPHLPRSIENMQQKEEVRIAGGYLEKRTAARQVD